MQNAEHFFRADRLNIGKYDYKYIVKQKNRSDSD